MNKSIEASLAIAGWTVVCEHPFEIEHEDGSFASGQAAQLVCDTLSSPRYERLSVYQRYQQSYKSLVDIGEMVQTWVNRVLQKSKESEDNNTLWQTLYDMVFSEDVNQQVHKLAGQLGQKFTWSDPDADYKDDVLAYVRALEAFIADLAVLLDSEEFDEQPR